MGVCRGGQDHAVALLEVRLERGQASSGWFGGMLLTRKLRHGWRMDDVLLSAARDGVHWNVLGRFMGPWTAVVRLLLN